MLSCFSVPEEEDNDIALIDNIIELTISFLYECPCCNCCITQEECYLIDIDRYFVEDSRFGKETCYRCFRIWRRRRIWVNLEFVNLIFNCFIIDLIHCFTPSEI